MAVCAGRRPASRATPPAAAARRPAKLEENAGYVLISPHGGREKGKIRHANHYAYLPPPRRDCHKPIPQDYGKQLPDFYLFRCLPAPQTGDREPSRITPCNFPGRDSRNSAMCALRAIAAGVAAPPALLAGRGRGAPDPAGRRRGVARAEIRTQSDGAFRPPGAGAPAAAGLSPGAPRPPAGGAGESGRLRGAPGTRPVLRRGRRLGPGPGPLARARPAGAPQ